MRTSIAHNHSFPYKTREEHSRFSKVETVNQQDLIFPRVSSRGEATIDHRETLLSLITNI